MPPYQKAKSKAQRIVAAIAEHDPEKLNSENKGMASMGQPELHAMASTSTKGMPYHASSTPNAKNVYAKKFKGIMGKKK